MSIAEQVSLAESSAHKPTEIKRIVASSVIGTAVEWYDFLIYGTASALVFNKLFFPLSDPALGTIAAFGTYAVGYLARPLGAAVFGHFGDRVGRKAIPGRSPAYLRQDWHRSASSARPAAYVSGHRPRR